MSEESNLHYLNIQNSVSCFLSLDSSHILNELIFCFLICVLHDILAESLLLWVYLYHFLSQIYLYSFSVWIITYLLGSVKEKTCVPSRSMFYHYFTNDITSLVRFNSTKQLTAYWICAFFEKYMLVVTPNMEAVYICSLWNCN